MKPKNPNLLVFLILTAGLLLSPASAAPVRTSQIVGYGTGVLGTDAATGTLDGWVNPKAQITVTNGSHSLDGTGLGLVSSAGDKVFISATPASGFGCRNQFASGAFPQTIPTNIYYSFLYRFNVATDVSSNGQKIVYVNRGNSGDGTGVNWELQVRRAGGQVQFGIDKPGGTTTNYAPALVNAGQTVFVVVRQQIITGLANDIDDLWVNPAPASFGVDESRVPTADATTSDGAEDQSTTGPGRFWIGSGASANFDELRIATTWAEATPPVGQCISAAISMDPTNTTQSAEISATFSVGAIGTSPTYQWQISANGGSSWSNIAGATTFTYTTPNLALTDNGNQYRAMALVSCNSSSATSAPAIVTLTAPVVTPVGVVLDDFFDDQLRDNTPVATSNSVWRTANSGSLDAITGDLIATPANGSSSLWLGYFTDDSVTNLPVHLGIDRALRVTLPFTPSSFNSFTNNGSLRIGLFDYADGGTRLNSDSSAAGGSAGNGVGVRGYILNLDFGTNFSAGSPLQLLGRTFLGDNNLMGSISDFTSLGSGPSGGGFAGAPAFQPGTNYTLVLTVARKDVNSVDVTASIAGGGTNWTFTATDTNSAYHRFDAFGLRPNSLETSADSFTFPEFLVEVVAVAPSAIPLNIQAAGNNVILTWSNPAFSLQSAPSVNGPFTAVPGATSPYTIPASGGQAFFRLIGN